MMAPSAWRRISMDKKNVFIGSSETSVDVSELLFCGEGRDGKRQLQRHCGITFFLPVACKDAPLGQR